MGLAQGQTRRGGAREEAGKDLGVGRGLQRGPILGSRALDLDASVLTLEVELLHRLPQRLLRAAVARERRLLEHDPVRLEALQGQLSRPGGVQRVGRRRPGPGPPALPSTAPPLPETGSPLPGLT